MRSFESSVSYAEKRYIIFNTLSVFTCIHVCMKYEVANSCMYIFEPRKTIIIITTNIYTPHILKLMMMKNIRLSSG